MPKCTDDIHHIGAHLWRHNRCKHVGFVCSIERLAALKQEFVDEYHRFPCQPSQSRLFSHPTVRHHPPVIRNLSTWAGDGNCCSFRGGNVDSLWSLENKRVLGRVAPMCFGLIESVLKLSTQGWLYAKSSATFSARAGGNSGRIMLFPVSCRVWESLKKKRRKKKRAKPALGSISIWINAARSPIFKAAARMPERHNTAWINRAIVWSDFGIFDVLFSLRVHLKCLLEWHGLVTLDPGASVKDHTFYPLQFARPRMSKVIAKQIAWCSRQL